MGRSKQTISIFLVICIAAAIFIIQAQADHNATHSHDKSSKNEAEEAEHKAPADPQGADPPPCPANYTHSDSSREVSVKNKLADEVMTAIEDEVPGSNDEAETSSNSAETEAASILTQKGTRRQLGGKDGGPCVASNSIDKCWRCDANWAKDRYRLAGCAKGFGRRTIGGKNGRIYEVTDPGDDNVMEPKPGTLRHAVIQKIPLWIIFARSMTITLKKELLMQSDKTIDGRGANVIISGGAGISIQNVRNIIIHSIHITNIQVTSGGMIRDSVDHIGVRAAPDGDAISIFGSTDIWIDHVSASNCKDGLVDVVAVSTGVTVSNSLFFDHDKVMLFGAEDNNQKDKNMRVTVAYSVFGKNLTQRLPRTRWGFFHLVNNDYTSWGIYAVGGTRGASIISQGNRFAAPPTPTAKEVTHRGSGVDGGWKSWNWRSEGDLMLNGAFFVESGSPNWRGGIDPLDLIAPAPAVEVPALTKSAGPLACRVGEPC